MKGPDNRQRGVNPLFLVFYYVLGSFLSILPLAAVRPFELLQILTENEGNEPVRGEIFESNL